MSPRPRLHFLSLLLAFAALSLAPTPARAELGGRVDADVDLGATAGDRFTAGIGARFGWRFDVGPVWLQPEVGGHYTAITPIGCDGCRRSTFPSTKDAARFLGGVRLGGSGLISGVIEPSIFGHAGYGWLLSFESELTGPAFDVGFALDVKVVRYFRFGAHGAYNVLAPTSGVDGPIPAEKWISVGLHLGVAF